MTSSCLGDNIRVFRAKLRADITELQKSKVPPRLSQAVSDALSFIEKGDDQLESLEDI